MTSAYSINLNFNNTIPVKTDFTFKQGDKGITLNLATTGLDTTGTTAHIVFKRSNGTSVEAELTGQTGPSYSYTILGNEFEIPGVVVADLKLYNGDTQRVSTASFIFLVTGDTMDGVGGGTGGYSDQLEQLSQEFEDTLTQYEEAFADVGAVHAAGNYDPTTEYSPLDLVYYSTDNSTYLCVEGCTGETPSPSSQHWQLVVDGSAMSTPNLGDLNDVDTTGAASGDLLGFDGADWEPVDFPDADDIDYDNTSSGLTATKVRAAIDEVKGLIPTIPTIPEKTSDLSDVASTAPTNGQILKYNGTSQKYEPANESGGGGGSQPNLLINGWFTINQRGQSTYSDQQYTVDRWWISNGSTLTVNNDKTVTITQASTYREVFQRLENPTALANKTLTITLDVVSGGNFPYLLIKSNNGTTIVTKALQQGLNIHTFTTDEHGVKDIMFNSLGDSNCVVTLKAVKLETGSTSTLHLDTAPDYTTELLKCQRYYYRIQANATNAYIMNLYTLSTDAAQAAYKLPTVMRTTPTFSLHGTGIVHIGTSLYNVSSTSIVMRTADHVLLIFNTTTVPAGSAGVFQLSSSGDYIEFDAEL